MEQEWEAVPWTAKANMSLAFYFCSNRGHYDLFAEIKRAMKLKTKL
jgi:hypothetical protein